MEFSLKHKEKETFPLPFSYFLSKTYVCILLSGERAISLVLSCCSKNLKRQMDQCYSSVLLASKGKCILEAGRQANPKDRKRREALSTVLSPLFMFFLLALRLPLCKLGWFVLPEVLTRPSFVLFSWAFPVFVF